MNLEPVIAAMVASVAGSSVVAWFVIRAINKVVLDIAAKTEYAVERAVKPVRDDIDSMKTVAALPSFITEPVTIEEFTKPNFEREKQALLDRIVEEQDKRVNLLDKLEALEKENVDLRTAQHREREVYATNKQNADNRLKEASKAYQQQITDLRNQLGTRNR